MDNEKYGIELELITDKFNQQMQKIKSAFTGLKDKKINVTADTSQIKYLEYQIDQLSAKLRALKETPITSPKFNYSEILKTEASLEKLKSQYNSLIGKQKQLSSSATFSMSGITKGLDKMTSKIKRFGLSLLSIRSIYSLVSRASSAYLAQDTELANKLQSAWAGLGAMLAPIIERIVDLIAKAVKYINIFIKALTGVDLLARATAKSMAGTAKSAKALNKALAGFDELQNLDTDAGGGGDIGGGLSGLNDVEINTEWAEKIRAFGTWFKDNWEYVTAGLLGTYLAIKLIGAGLGVVKAIGIGLLIAGIIIAVKNLIKYLKDPSWTNFGKIIQGIGIALLGLAVIIESVPLAVAGAVIAITGTVIKYWNEIKSFLQNGIDWLTSKTDWVREYFGVVGEYIYTMWVKKLQNILNWFDKTFKSIKGIFDGLITFLRGAFTGNWEQAWKGLSQIFTSIFNGMVNTAITAYNLIFNKSIELTDNAINSIARLFKNVINSVLSAIERILNTPIRQINRLTDVINKVPGINLGKLSTFSLPRLNVGTNYVPEDQLAMIHKGEAVIPKKFNSREYFGNNDETNAKLDDLIEAVRNIEINPYTTIKDVGKASLNYINAKSRQLGESVVV